MTSKQSGSSEQTKRCTKCKEEKTINKFTSKYSFCNDCRNKRRREDRKEHPEKEREYRKKIAEKRLATIERCRKNRIAKMTPEERKAEKKKSLLTSRKSSLKKDFGLTLEEYHAMLEMQKGVCAICKQPETTKNSHGTVRFLAVDHCHRTGKVRGLLCGKCNTRLGIIEDIVYVQAAQGYLEQYKF